MSKRREIEVEVQREVWVTKQVKPEDEIFTKATEVAYEVLKDLGGNCFGIYMTLLKHRNTKNNRCFPSIETLKKETGMSKNTVNKCIKELYEKGYININSGYKGINSNYYFLKESFYKLFLDDYCQKNATRRKGKECLTEKRETKKDKENKELKEENKKKDETIRKLEKKLKDNGIEIEQEGKGSDYCSMDELPF